jgi:hypothetical protein
LLKTAQGKLAVANTEAFKILILALGAGLRRGEIDRLLWRQIDFKAGVIRIEATEVGDLKSEDSAGEVAIDETLCGILQGFKAKARSQFVIEGPEEEKASSRAWGHAYRCTPTFEFLSTWLRKQGVDNNKPLHTLRKEAGAMVATRQGIYAASRFLRHADIQVTAMHYADHKERVTVDMGALLEPENVTDFLSPPPGRKRTRDPQSKNHPMRKTPVTAQSAKAPFPYPLPYPLSPSKLEPSRTDLVRKLKECLVEVHGLCRDESDPQFRGEALWPSDELFKELSANINALASLLDRDR